MSETAQPEALERGGPVMSATAEPSVRGRRGLRITLLMLAAAILVFGAAVAGVFGYLTLSRGMLSARADLAVECGAQVHDRGLLGRVYQQVFAAGPRMHQVDRGDRETADVDRAGDGLGVVDELEGLRRVLARLMDDARRRQELPGRVVACRRVV